MGIVLILQGEQLLFCRCLLIIVVIFHTLGRYILRDLERKN